MNATITKSAVSLAQQLEVVRLQNMKYPIGFFRDKWSKDGESNEEKRQRKIRYRKAKAEYRESKIKLLKLTETLNYIINEDDGKFVVETEYCICREVTDTMVFDTYDEAFRFAANKTINGWHPYRYGECEKHISDDILDSYSEPCHCGGQRIPLTYDRPTQDYFCTSCGNS